MIGVHKQGMLGVYGGGVSDPDFASVVLLMHMDGSDDGTTFTDVKGHTFTRAGSTLPVTKTGTKQFGTASGYFGPGGADDRYLTTPDSNDWAFGSGNYTIEGWYYPVNLTAVASICGQWNGSASWLLQIGTNGRIAYATSPNGGTVFQAFGSTAMTVNAWNYFALSKVSGRLRMYQAVAGDTNTTETYNYTANFADTLFNSTGIMAIGANHGTALYDFQNLAGYLDELRITKGVARYTSTFAVPTAAFPDS